MERFLKDASKKIFYFIQILILRIFIPISNFSKNLAIDKSLYRTVSNKHDTFNSMLKHKSANFGGNLVSSS